MKFHIEVIRDDAATPKVVYRTTIDEMNPGRAKTKAAALLSLYERRGANKVRVLNQKDEELFTL